MNIYQNKDHYYQSTEYKVNRQFIGRWAKKIKAIDLLGGKCKICEEQNPLKLSFHHENRDIKTEEISLLACKNWSKLKKELQNCICVCENCHREIHSELEKNGDERTILNKQIILEYKKLDGCEMCGYNKHPRALEFHHNNEDEKLFMISKIRKRFHNINDLSKSITDELDKCQILCANCHRMQHSNKEKFEKYKTEIYEKVKTLDTEKEKHKTNIEDVILHYKNGKTCSEISRLLDKTRSTISQILSKLKQDKLL